MTGIVDGYAHAGMAKYRPIPELLTAMRASDVSRAVLVQHLKEYDNAYIGGAIRRDPDRFAGVALVDPFCHDWQARLAAVVALGFRGLRFRAEWLRAGMEVAIAAGGAGLHLVLYVTEMVEAVGAIRRLAEVSTGIVVVAHLGAPRIRPDDSVDAGGLLDLASHSNVWTTLSGLSMSTAHPHVEMDGFIGQVVDRFGSERIMWGSNFPVGLPEEPYGADMALVRSDAWGLTDAGAADVLGRSAGRLWFGPRIMTSGYRTG